ncbi:hypothetical protein [Actinoallomurus soli]|uniref:hypothetical protein n=1 Tax=Actinoallomurus soli TaxID=2952535 RepID=UPI002093B3C9|nr:hypothetical protein [Actinoallomurus soli]MCO5971552.1 hypothetical protein [Actinoallomurus soli]
MTERRYRYVGPVDLLSAVKPGEERHAIGSPGDLISWLTGRDDAELAEPFTYVVDLTGTLRLAPRRSEHVACAGGAPVLGAGELTFRHEWGRWIVYEISNQSTGYCPDVTTWPAVRDALDRAGLEHPGHFTHPVIFRRCPACDERNVVRDDDYHCVFCDTELPAAWNVDPRA